MIVTCECPPKWDGEHLIPCDHELARNELWWERHDEYWGNET